MAFVQLITIGRHNTMFLVGFIIRLDYNHSSGLVTMQLAENPTGFEQGLSLVYNNDSLTENSTCGDDNASINRMNQIDTRVVTISWPIQGLILLGLALILR